MRSQANTLPFLIKLTDALFTKITAYFTVGMFLIASCQSADSYEKVERWDIFELELRGPVAGNPYMEVELHAVFEGENGNTIQVPGFYDGEGIFRVRFSPAEEGVWSYITVSNSANLAGKTGKISCIAPSGENHGPLKIINTYYLQYADSSPYYGIGTTAYQWTSVKQSIQEKTLETLRDSPFNKIRMCIFPKDYVYGNKTEPWAYPFARDSVTNDFTKPNVAFFQNFDKRVKQLMDMGIQADVILFHPYDRWGYAEMGAEMNEKYVRYVMARLSAYRNVWWSLANEWDVPSIKESIDWKGIGTLLQQEDPHQRFRGIHNWYSSEDHFYDHTESWITHVSTQTYEFYNAERWREMYQKPLLFDEMRYEGDVESGWGNLTGEEMSAYFWMAGLSGGYPTHGDTFKNDSDDETEVRWWAKGGTLMGESPDRIAFFKSIMEELPIREMEPKLIPGENPKELMKNQYLLSNPGEIYLIFAPEADQEIVMDLPGDGTYNLQVLDTWGMEIKEEKPINAGEFRFITSDPYTALKFVR
ncbi:DUF5060 domain-containing protein [Lunatibacter salilacus]|uniref:DUF5060 domain-containing protein n=1 Tax=Lunatibacter salilacus TaxID=2483804 RepID=UPI00131C1BE4|nr:DUF5060 domain-containing protein [Lunatibacter salilacus]